MSSFLRPACFATASVRRSLVVSNSARHLACARTLLAPFGSACASFHTRTCLAAQNSNHNSEMSDNDPNRIEHAKEKLLEGQVKSPFANAPGWSETLATESEASVKADESNPESFHSMQRETIEYVHEEH
ncbi:hypothetical protein BJ085DRAFT_33976 [Dimargaris cristalligena]|uniref:Uncharacterized protein n=1 Tax=Dimargaris cristalligena TaxID=215637 RepID=A0A4P9ZQ83_9FUNG|nr:hypothetical protein BJ085DRAFT_33976 [Dimargaris cristalligena]|eukprot:RKP35543.1 hypothetical protein BJ085DRAFT_33976 [Dimargaris cristalligena]